MATMDLRQMFPERCLAGLFRQFLHGPGACCTISSGAFWRAAIIWCLVVAFLPVPGTHAQDAPLDWEMMPTGTAASLRGLHAVDASIIWACGSAATVLRSADGGLSWITCGPIAYADLEFRSVHAWNEREACIASAGSPAVILKTTDGGESWREVFRDPSPHAFFDALRFWDERRGLAFSDPVDGKLLIVETQDAGRSWTRVDPARLPAARDAEAGFAASNSALCLGADGRVWIGTGGSLATTSRIYLRLGWDEAWQVAECPLPSSASEGIFSLALRRVPDVLIAVGGDYRPNQVSKATAAISRDAGVTWQLVEKPPRGYRSAVVRLSPEFTHKWTGTAAWIATGPAGSDYSLDGTHWTALSPEGFHALATADDTLFACGADGRFAVLRRTQRAVR